MKTPQRILIVNPFGIGDVLFTTPVIRAVRRAFPESWIGYLCNRRTERILRDNPHLNELFVYEKDDVVRLWRESWLQAVKHVGGLLRRLQHSRIDLLVDLSLGERYSLIMKALGVRRRIGFDYRQRGRFLTGRLPIDGYHDAHVVDYYRQLLRFIGIALVDDTLELRITGEEERWAQQWFADQPVKEPLLVGMVPAGGVSWGVDAPFRRWSLEGFARVADALIERYGARVVLFGESADVSLCRAVAQRMRHPVTDVSGKTTLGQFVSLLGRLNLVICNDGGPLHLAVSQRVKTVSIFGPVDPRVYGPYPSRGGGHRVVSVQHLPCRPCYRQFKLPPCPYERACLTTIEPDDVLEACAAALNAHDDARAVAS